MSNQLLKDHAALRMFFTDTLYVTPGELAAGSSQLAGEQPVVGNLQVPQPETQNTQPIHFKFIGKNKRGILLLVNDPAHAVSNEAGTVLLRNIVRHLQFDKDDFALLNYAHYPGTSFKTLQEFFKCGSLLAFGVTPAELGLNVNGPSHTTGSTRIVFGAPLHEMADSQDAKKSFWGVLKTIDKW